LHDIFDGDTYFPEISEKDWEIIDQIKGETDEKNPFQFSFITYQRRQS
jgi:dihydrofolate reductase